MADLGFQTTVFQSYWVDGKMGGRMMRMECCIESQYWDRYVRANSTDPDQTKQSDLGPHTQFAIPMTPSTSFGA